MKNFNDTAFADEKEKRQTNADFSSSTSADFIGQAKADFSAQPNGEPSVTPASDDEVAAASAELIELNLEAYKELAK